MTLKIATLSLFLIVLTACKQQVGEKKQNANGTTLKYSYAENAVKIISQDSILNGSSQIEEYNKNQECNITFVESIYRTEANKDRGIAYEIIQSKAQESKEYVQLVIWENKLRAFEYTVENTIDSKNVDITHIADIRNLWIKLCNAHNAESLVNQLYTSDAIYFNHKPIVIGTADLAKEYAYMNDANYTLILKPSIVKAVNSTIVFEIGQCTGSYNGKYVLVWQKQPSGEWKISIDCNV